MFELVSASIIVVQKFIGRSCSFNFFSWLLWMKKRIIIHLDSFFSCKFGLYILLVLFTPTIHWSIVCSVVYFNYNLGTVFSIEVITQCMHLSVEYESVIYMFRKLDVSRRGRHYTISVKLFVFVMTSSKIHSGIIVRVSFGYSTSSLWF